jgi:trans-AT polyketide synthase, acyltransferase and oxidoreductase domains
MNVVMFAGQGSQKRGAGSQLFGRHAQLLERASDVLGYSVSDLVASDEGARLSDTEFAQPAIFVLNHLYWLEYVAQNAAPAVAVGHSLGEYNALVSAGMLTFEEGLRLVQMRGHLMGQARGGGMSAIVGVSPEAIDRERALGGLDDVEIANFNTPRQHVVSGSLAHVEALEARLSSTAKCFRLAVSGAFHSKFMRRAANYFGLYLERFVFRPPQLRVYSNAHGTEYSVENARRFLTDQIRMAVRWSEIMQSLLQAGHALVELGHSRILTNMTKDFKP